MFGIIDEHNIKINCHENVSEDNQVSLPFEPVCYNSDAVLKKSTK